MAKINMSKIRTNLSSLRTSANSGLQKTRTFVRKISRPVEKFANAYGRALRRLMAFVIGFSLLNAMRAEDPTIFASFPALNELLDSSSIFVEWVATFLRWNFEFLKEVIDYLGKLFF